MTASLANVAIGRRIRIDSLGLDVDSIRWLAAVGLHEGEELVILRRAALGGPLHVRTSAGGEFAIARELAAHIAVSPAGVDDAPAPDSMHYAHTTMEQT